jgi:hypothetical protein
MSRYKEQKILEDEVIVLNDPNPPAPELMRRVVALGERHHDEVPARAGNNRRVVNPVSPGAKAASTALAITMPCSAIGCKNR